MCSASFINLELMFSLITYSVLFEKSSELSLTPFIPSAAYKTTASESFLIYTICNISSGYEVLAHCAYCRCVFKLLHCKYLFLLFVVSHIRLYKILSNISRVYICDIHNDGQNL